MSEAYKAASADGQLKISFRGGFPLKLAGSIFLVCGLYILYQLSMGIIGSARDGSILSNLVGMCFFTAVMLVFLVPGWVLTISRLYVLVDPVERVVLDVKDHLVYKQVKAHSWADLRELMVTDKVLKTKSKGRTRRSRLVYRVKFNLQDGGEVLVADMDDIDPAMELGEKISELTGLPVKPNIR